jgi:hypothetical protein
VKRHLLSLTKQELQDLLLAVQGEADWLVIHGSSARRRRYKRLEKVLAQKLENVVRHEAFINGWNAARMKR